MDERSELDRRIRDLVGRAVADAPPAPGVDDETLMVGPDPASANRWLLGGMTGLGIAAAVVAIFLFARPNENADPLVPATRPPATTLATATTIAAVTEATDPVPTSATATVMLPDGRTVMQRTYNVTDPAADSALLVTEPGATTPVALDVPGEFTDVGLRLHDAAAVGDEIIVIVETRPGTCANPTECVGALWAFGPDSGRLDRLQEKNVWESGWSRLSLASTGVVFGTETDSVTSTLRSWIVPGADAEPIDFGAEGLDETYGDCTDCPTGFTIDRHGDFLAWVETDLTTFQTTLVFANLGDDDVERVPLTDAGTVCCLDGIGPDLPVVPVVEFDLSVVADQGLIRAVVNDEGVLNGDPPRPALVVDIATGEVTAAEGFHAFG